jgi:transcriptional regulator NrdR family protein
MKCPHCHADSTALILETRKAGEDIMRRRVCGTCGTSFVSREYTEAGMKLPPTVRIRVGRVEPGPKATNLDAFKAWR